MRSDDATASWDITGPESSHVRMAEENPTWGYRGSRSYTVRLSP
jgi:hypothetical protein